MRNSVEVYRVRQLAHLAAPDDLFRNIVSHKIYGIPQTINSANYVYFLAYRELFALRSHVQSQASAPDRPHRLIDDTELDRLVTGTCRTAIARSKILKPTKRNCFAFIEDKD